MKGLQVPDVRPCWMKQLPPGQQSALVVQGPEAGTHDCGKQTKGGLPFGLETHGERLQQSALDEQPPSAGTQAPASPPL